MAFRSAAGLRGLPADRMGSSIWAAAKMAAAQLPVRLALERERGRMGLPETAAGSSFISGVPIVQWRRRVHLQPGVIGFGRTLLFWSLKGAVRLRMLAGNSVRARLVRACGCV